MSEQKNRIHVVINPAAGKDEPILNTINDVFTQHDIDWGVSVTRKFGDATEFARQAAEGGFDIVAGYGGDGTQHEIANGIFGTKALMGVLPGGTGNGFANELGTPNKLRPALELLCTDHKVRHVDVVQKNDDYFIQRLYVVIEPEVQTSRESEDRYGTSACAIDSFHRAQHIKEDDLANSLTADSYGQSKGGHNDNRNGTVHPIPSHAAGAQYAGALVPDCDLAAKIQLG